MNIIKSFSLMSFLTFMSRIFGYIRDLFFAFIFGASSSADNFLLAFRLPNLFRRLFGEGAINNAFIPIYLDVKKISSERAILFSSNSLGLIFIILAVVTVISLFFMKPIITLLAPGFSEDNIIKTSYLASIMFPYLILISLSSFFAALLNANGRYLLWAFCPIILNIFMILAMILSYYKLLITEILLSWSVLLSGLIQIIILFIWIRKKNIKVKFVKPKITRNIKKLLKLIFPNILAGGIIQINQFIGVIFASSIPGAISWLYYADRITQLPLGIFVISISTILLTLLSKNEANNNIRKIKNQVDISCLLMLSFTMISMVGLLILSDLIIDILFRRGKFGYGDVLATSDAIKMYALGLPAFGFIKIFSVIFFSKQNTLIPFKVSALAMVINFILIYILVNKIGHLGIALALSISSWFNAVILYIYLRLNNFWKIDKNLLIKFLKVIICSFITFTIVVMVNTFILYTDYFNLNNLLSKTMVLSLLILLAGIIFFLLFFVLGIMSLKDFRKKNIKNILKEH